MRKLSFSGIDIQGTNKTESPDRLNDYSVFVSPVDSIGNISLCISMKKSGTRSETMFVVINDEAGIIDVFGSKEMKNSELDSMIDEVRKDSFLSERDLSYALKLINDALLRSEKNGLPLPPEFHYRKEILKGMLKPRSYRPRFKLSTVRKVYRDESLIKRSGELFEIDEFREWLLSVPRVFDYAEKLTNIRKKTTSPLIRLKEQELINSFCVEVISPLRGLFMERLFKMADFLYQSKHSEESARLALATALKLGSKNIDAVTNIPFVKAMAEKSIEHCAEAIESGFDLRNLSGELDGLED